MDIVLGHCEAKRIFSLDCSTVSDPFVNESINRKASPDLIREILNYMAENSIQNYIPNNLHNALLDRAEWQGKNSNTCLIYWKNPEEWAGLIYGHIRDSGQIGSIVTVYELFQGDETVGCQFHGLPELFWGRVLKALQRSGKAAIFGAESDSLITPETGLKFI